MFSLASRFPLYTLLICPPHEDHICPAHPCAPGALHRAGTQQAANKYGFANQKPWLQQSLTSLLVGAVPHKCPETCLQGAWASHGFLEAVSVLTPPPPPLCSQWLPPPPSSCSLLPGTWQGHGLPSCPPQPTVHITSLNAMSPLVISRSSCGIRLWVFLAAQGLALHARGRHSRCVAGLTESQCQRRISLTIRDILPRSHASQACACPNLTLPRGDKQLCEQEVLPRWHSLTQRDPITDHDTQHSRKS